MTFWDFIDHNSNGLGMLAILVGLPVFFGIGALVYHLVDLAFIAACH